MLLLLPVLFETFGYSLLPWESIGDTLGSTEWWGLSDHANKIGAQLKHRKGLFSKGLPISQVDSREPSLAALYNSTRAPPKGFEKWIAYAKLNKCHLGPYTRIDKDLEAFRHKGKLRISKQQVADTAGLPRTLQFTVRDGKLHTEGDSWWVEKFLRMAEGFQKDLPDMDFVVNGMDEPRVLPGKGSNIDARYHSQQCQNASESFREFRYLHGSFSNRPDGFEYFPTKELLPLFSQSKINECHADITFPTHYNLDQLLSEEELGTLPPWEERKDTLFFRGSTTGGHYNQMKDYTIAHRQRLVEFAKGKPQMDIGFTAIIQCNNICDELQDRYGTVSRVEGMDNFRYKYLMSVDGNTFVSRLPRFMSAGSLIFRAGLFGEWFDEWIFPDRHFLQVKLDYSDLETKLRWALDHDKEARKIAEEGQRFAHTRLRNEDMSCYLYRLLLEYSAILER